MQMTVFVLSIFPQCSQDLFVFCWEKVIAKTKKWEANVHAKLGGNRMLIKKVCVQKPPVYDYSREKKQ